MFDDNNYILYKKCELVLVTKDVSVLLEQCNDLNSYEFLVYFKEFINEFIDKGYLSPLMKNNILNFLNVLRFIDSDKVDKKWSKKIWLIIDIIRLVNSKDCNKYVTYYRKEMFKRTNNNDYLNLPSCFILQSEEKLCKSIGFDYLVLLSHSDLVDDYRFNKEYLSQIIGNWKYFETINCILEEYPNIFLDQTFIKRYLSVMNEFYSRDYGEPFNYGIVMFGDKVKNKTKDLKNI